MISSSSRSVLRLLQIRPARRTPPEFAYFTIPLADVVGSVHGHHFAGADDVDFLRLVFADRHGEATTNHVTQHVVEHEVEVFV
jgi:hypothetical protein